MTFDTPRDSTHILFSLLWDLSSSKNFFLIFFHIIFLKEKNGLFFFNPSIHRRRQNRVSSSRFPKTTAHFVCVSLYKLCCAGLALHISMAMKCVSRLSFLFFFCLFFVYNVNLSIIEFWIFYSLIRQKSHLFHFPFPSNGRQLRLCSMLRHARRWYFTISVLFELREETV